MFRMMMVMRRRRCWRRPLAAPWKNEKVQNCRKKGKILRTTREVLV